MGSKLGWIISGAIVLSMVVLLTFVFGWGPSLGNATAATLGPGKLDAIVMDLDPAKVIKVPSGSGAEKTYAALITEALAGGDPRDFVDYAKAVSEPEKNQRLRSLLAKLQEAADQGMDSSVELNFSELPVRAATEFTTGDFLKTLGKIATTAAMSLNADGKKAEADKAARAGLLYGLRLWKHGTYRPYKLAGLFVTGDGLAALGRIHEDDKDKAQACKELNDIRKDAGIKWDAKEKALIRNLNNLNPRDLANLAEKDQDRAWRLEGAIWLGIAQWSNASGGQRTAIQSFLKKLSASDDPLLAEAAKKSLNTARNDIQEVAAQN